MSLSLHHRFHWSRLFLLGGILGAVLTAGSPLWAIDPVSTPAPLNTPKTLNVQQSAQKPKPVNTLSPGAATTGASTNSAPKSKRPSVVYPSAGHLQEGQPFARPMVNRSLTLPASQVPPSWAAGKPGGSLPANTAPAKVPSPAAQFGAVTPAQGSMPDGVFLNTNTQALYSQIGQFETRLYGHAYPNQTLHKRVARIERTLFGESQTGPLEMRFSQLVTRMAQDKGLPSSADETATLSYLEQRFYQRTYSNWTTAQRLSQLEQYVFGKTNEAMPPADRLKKLAFTVPVQAKEIRVVNKDKQIVATTNPKKAGVKPPPETLQPVSLDVNDPTLKAAPRPQKALPGAASVGALASGAPSSNNDGLSAPPDYLEALYHIPTTKKVLRWTHTPVWVYVQQGTKEEILLVHQAVQFWGGSSQMRVSLNIENADILVDWAGAPATRLKPLTRTNTVLDGQKNVRNVVMVDMAHYHPMNYKEKMRGMIHQLGHAYGIWGHSDDPHDVMYPQTAQEASDIPELWNQGMVRFSSQAPEPLGDDFPVQPSQRDRNTMVQLYKAPAEDLRLYVQP